MMTDQPQQSPPVTDPDNVPEILCDGQFYVSTADNLATLTFTHVRQDAALMFRGVNQPSAVVRARIVLTSARLAALRDLLNQVVIQTPVSAAGDAFSRS
jgi:hypothetical protein